MAQLKSTNIAGNLVVNGSLLFSNFARLGGTNTQVLLANGDIKEISGTWPISVSGNAATATKATNDANNAAIHTTYVKLSECSNAGNRASGKVVTAAAAGQINSDKYLVTSSGTGKVTLQYNTTYKALEFSF